jgi:type II secretory pathway pseudopilin PulG
MIVILVISILLAIAVPQMIRQKGEVQQKTCVSNLKLMDAAKESYAYEHRIAEGSSVDARTVWIEYCKGELPVCPAGGAYTLGVVGEPPQCSRGNLTPGHKLPGQ